MSAKQRPIMFTTSSMKANLAGRKIMTRRPVKHMPKQNWLTDDLINISPALEIGQIGNRLGVQLAHPKGGPLGWIYCPYGSVGDVLWCREIWGIGHKTGARYYKANTNYPETICKWNSPRYMPKDAARLFLEITDVRVERLQDITDEDAEVEGIGPNCDCNNPVVPGACENCYNTGYSYPPTHDYEELWESINGKGSWALNPWVWVISYKRIDKPTE